MLVHSIPETAVIPVATTDGDDSLIGGEGIVIVDASAGALYALALIGSTYIIIERGYGIDINVGSRGVYLVFFELVLRLVLDSI